jgi:hypothetical protein
MSHIVTLSAEPRTGCARAKWVREELKADRGDGGGGAWEATGCLGRDGPAVGCRADILIISLLIEKKS